MTNSDQNSEEQKELPPLHLSFDSDEMSAAASQENAALLEAQIRYLTNRVALLRASVTRLQAENRELRAREE